MCICVHMFFKSNVGFELSNCLNVKKFIRNVKYIMQHRIERSQTIKCIQYNLHDTMSSIAQMLCVLILHMSGGTYSDWERQIFEKLSMPILFAPRIFARRKSLEKYFSIFSFWCLFWFKHCLTSNKTTDYFYLFSSIWNTSKFTIMILFFF